MKRTRNRLLRFMDYWTGGDAGCSSEKILKRLLQFAWAMVLFWLILRKGRDGASRFHKFVSELDIE